MRSFAETHLLLSDQWMVIKSMHGAEASQRRGRLRYLGLGLRSCHQSKRSIGSYWLQISTKKIMTPWSLIKMSDRRNLRLRKVSLVERAHFWRIYKLSFQPKLAYYLNKKSSRIRITALKSSRTKFKSLKDICSYRRMKRLRKSHTICWRRPIRSMK